MEAETPVVKDFWGGQDPDLPDPSSMSDEQRKMYLAALEAFTPKLDQPVGQVMIFGTGGDMEENTNLKDMFFNPEHYSLDKGDTETTSIVRYFQPVWKTEE